MQKIISPDILHNFETAKSNALFQNYSMCLGHYYIHSLHNIQKTINIINQSINQFKINLITFQGNF